MFGSPRAIGHPVLVELAGERGDLDELRRLAGLGDSDAADVPARSEENHAQQMRTAPRRGFVARARDEDLKIDRPIDVETPGNVVIMPRGVALRSIVAGTVRISQ